MPYALTIANVDRASDHAALFAVVVLIAAVGGLVYVLVQLAGKRRAGRTRPGRRPEGPET
jgi:hypothetical protein